MRRSVLETPEQASTAIRTTLNSAHLPATLHDSCITHLLERPDRAIDFLMRFQHALPASAFPKGYALLSGLVISLGYVSGGIVPLLPYLFMPTIDGAFALSIIVTALVLVSFGAAKTWFVGETARWGVLRGGAEMLVLGGTAAGAAVGCVKAFS